MNNNTPHTNTREGGGRNKEEKDTNTPPTLATTRASPEREGKSRKRTPRKADQRKRRRWGGGRTTPWKPEKDTRDLTQPSLPGDATDQPNPHTKNTIGRGLKGINKSHQLQSLAITLPCFMYQQQMLGVRSVVSSWEDVSGFSVQWNSLSSSWRFLQDSLCQSRNCSKKLVFHSCYSKIAKQNGLASLVSGFSDMTCQQKRRKPTEKFFT